MDYTNGDYFKSNVSYHEEDSLWKVQHLSQLLFSLPFKFSKPQSLVDIGCGTGSVTFAICRLFPSITEVYLVEPNQEAARIASSKLQSLDVSVYIYPSVCDIPNAISFDLCMSIDSIEHIIDQSTVLKFASLRSNYTLWNIPLDVSLISLIRSASFDRLVSRLGHIHFYNKTTAKIMLQSHGFAIVSSLLGCYGMYKPSYHTKLFSRIKGLFQRMLKLVFGVDLAVAALGDASFFVLTSSPVFSRK